MARRTWWSRWPCVRRSHGWRSSVAKAKRSEFAAVTSGRRSSRFFAAVPSRIQMSMPRRTFSCASARERHSWSERMPAPMYAFRSRPERSGECPSIGTPRRRASSTLRDDAGVAEEEAGHVHHLGEPEDVREVVERREVGRRERGARRLEMRGRHARRQHDEDVHGEVRRGLEEGPDPRHAPHVRDLVRVRDRRRRAVHGREARERRRRRHRGFDVEMRVPERGRDVGAPEVDLVVLPGRDGSRRSRGSGRPSRRRFRRGSRPSGRSRCGRS